MGIHLTHDQIRLFDGTRVSEDSGEEQHELTPAEDWNEDTVKHALDELFNLARKYKTSESYRKLIDFIARFRFYSPYNALLVHIQMPGATFVAPPHRWLQEYGRKVKANAHPLVILRPGGPVMFVFDALLVPVSPTIKTGLTSFDRQYILGNRF